ncbi:hypothetical protein JS528_04375 [Bifidobacterium sp. MA2]|uniref:Uncharacterized protein n=1 Tax=Bifidobacterium santillanense TaxID=2809028 RepID=A0ABS5UP40_9BIFI|nr:hypothetical protein [Bifidobacterium santillanense]MBT1172603.1 hypothetical protein [Bifidobacterium santillanense]
MKPQLGDTLFNRYTLVALLRDEPGVQAWKANDRVLAQDCQLFILTAPETLDDVSALTSQAGRKDGLTPVLQFRKAGEAAVLVTKLETGLSLTEYLRGKARGTLSYEAMRSVIGDAATIVSGLEAPRLSTDTIRVSVTGVEIADVPLTHLLVEPTGAPETMPTEQLAIRQLAAVLYGMLKRRPVTPDTTFDLSSLDADMPTEFHVILSRGLELTGRTGKKGEPMLTLGELTALLGDWTPLDQLSDRDIALPTDAGEGSISTVAVRDLSKSALVELPAGDVTTERLPDLEIHRAPSEQEAARHADAVVAAQNAQSFADMEESFKEYSPHDFFAMGRNVPPDERARIAAQSYVAPAAGEQTGQLNAPGHDTQHRTDELVNDFSFQVYPAPVALPDDMNTGEQTSRIPIINESNMPTVSLDVRDPENMAIEGFEDFANPHEAGGAYGGHGDGRVAPKPGKNRNRKSGKNAKGGNAAEATKAPADAQGKPESAPQTPADGNEHIAPGSMPPAIPVSPALPPRPVSSDFDMQHPPSFKPKSMLDHDPADDEHEDLSDHRLLGNMTTATVALIAAALVLVALLAGALFLFLHSGNPQDQKVQQNNEWPDDTNVPFGDDQSDGSGSQQQSGGSSSSSSASDESGVVLIDVTDVYRR